MSNTSHTKRNARRLAAQYALIKKQLQSIQNREVIEGLSQSQANKRNELYKEMNEAKVSLIRLGCDPEQAVKYFAAEKLQKTRARQYKRLGLKATKSTGNFRVSRRKGGVGAYSLGNSRRIWK